MGGRTQEVETTSAQVILSQPLFRGGRTIAEIRKTKALVRSGRAELRALENEVMLSGINVLADLNRDYAIDASFGESTRLLERTLAAVREMRSYKAATATDVSQVEARLARTRRGAASVREQLAQSIAEYVRITGEHPTSLSAEFEGPDVMLSENALQNSAEGHPSVIGAKEAEIAAGHAVREAFGAIQPEVSLNAQYQYGYNQVPGVPTGVSQGTTTLYVQARWQFYQGGVEYASLRQAKALSEQRHSELIQTRREVQKAIAQAHAALIASKGALSASQAELQANMSAYEGVVTAQKGGEKSILDVLNATEEYLNARVAVARAKRDRVASAFQLIASIGQLTPERLALPVKRYDPTENYNQVVGSWIGFGK